MSGATGGGLERPAAIDADPTRVTNVLAPPTGRDVALKVGLRDHVKKGQILATLASGDFAQVQSDVDKARDAQDLPRKVLTHTQSGRCPVSGPRGSSARRVVWDRQLERREGPKLPR